jgi:cytochrome P450
MGRWLIMRSFAGSDTTAASLRAIFYYLCRNSQAHRKLLDEIDDAEKAGKLSDPVTFGEALNLKYFQACVKEALRMHPAVGLLLERLVPQGGADIGGVWLPEGTVIGMNPWVAARDKTVYGEDAYSFRPERWLEADEKQLKLMERNFLAFGAGARTCLGKNISLLEMSKLVPQVLRRFDFELTDPSKEWQLHGYWFVRQTGLICKAQKREKQVLSSKLLSQYNN